MSEESLERTNFIEQIVEKDIESKLHDGKVVTRFPPEPNGHLHIGHAKSICLNFGIAQKYGGVCNLRFDDTNPEKEEGEYVTAIKENVKWLGFGWEGEPLFTSNYFENLYAYAIRLIEKGLAYVDDSTSEEMAASKGTPTEPGKNSPFRERTIDENLQLFEEMKDGVYQEGEKVLRAKIDMASPNMQMRDPVIYRVKKVPHHRTGSKWNIYPMYDFAHGQSDSIEGVTHSLCTLEFEVHRPLYDWLIENIGIFPSKQYEFARLNLTYTVLSKRKLLQLVNEGLVSSWDDPRMPTLSGMRRRGFTPSAIRNFCDKIGVVKRDSIVDVALLEFSLREDLNKSANRVMAVLEPIKLIIENYPEDKEELLDAENNPEDQEAGSRKMAFSRELYIDRSDFMEDPPRKFFRLGPGREVRLKHAYIVECTGFKKDDNGEVVEVICRYDAETKSGADNTGKKVKGTLSWVSANHSVNAEVRLYDRLFVKEDLVNLGPDEDFKDFLNPNSLEVKLDAKIEASVKGLEIGETVQFLRQGYFCLDPDSGDDLIFNRTIPLRDTWAKKS